MVFAFAGDSTITSRLLATAGHDSAMPKDEYWGRATACHLQRRRRPQLARLLRPFSPAFAGRGAPAPGGRIRPRLQPSVELRPLAAGPPDLAPALAQVHGQVRAVLVPAERGRQRRGCLSRPPGTAGHGRDR